MLYKWRDIDRYSSNADKMREQNSPIRFVRNRDESMVRYDRSNRNTCDTITETKSYFYINDKQTGRQGFEKALQNVFDR